MAVTLLITAKEVVDRVMPDTNFDEGYFKDRYIESAQMNYIRPVLGADFYDLVLASPSSYSALMPYIKDALAFFVVAEALPMIHVNVTTRGVMMNSNEFSAPAGRDARSDVDRQLRAWGQEYLDKMERYLTDNTSTYTDYAPLTSGGKLLGGILMY